MIYTYGFTQRGYYHIHADTVCQDAHLIKKVDDNLCFAAVADGLGSELYSDIASKLAVEKAIEFCASEYNEGLEKEQIFHLIRQSFSKAQKSIEEKASADNHPIEQYDATLSLVIMVGETLYYGHSGDSGIVVLSKNGEYKAITQQQRDENGCVFPLCFTDKWVFGIEEGVASVLLATDGMLETFFPSLLHNEPVSIYVALAQFFMDYNSLGYDKATTKQVEDKIENFISNITEAQVSDDKTVVCLINSEVQVEKKDEEYYKIPNWAELKRKKDEEFRRLAYPHLYKTDKE